MSDLRAQLLRVKAELAASRSVTELPTKEVVMKAATTPMPRVKVPLARAPAQSPPQTNRVNAPRIAVLRISELPRSVLVGRNKRAILESISQSEPVQAQRLASAKPPAAQKVATQPLLGVPMHFRPLPKGEPTRRSLFKLPAEWVAAGGQTQCVVGDTRGTVDIFIGIDFGTSFTKAAVGLRDVIYPVTWEGVSSCMPPYLLPSEHTTLDDGTLHIGQHPDAPTAALRSDLKLPFISEAVSMASIRTAGEFLSLVLRYIRAWVFQHHSTKIGGAAIRWYFNLGAPSDGLERQRLELAYRRLAASSWIRSLSLDCMRLADFDVQDWHDDIPLPDLIACDVKPEFVAQMAGYMQSPQRRKGLHALIDVGGGTLDIVTFNVHQIDDEDTFPFLVPGVHPLGTHGLLQNRLCGLPNDRKSMVVDELKPVAGAEAFASLLGIDSVHVNVRDRLFATEIKKVVRSVFETTKSRRYRLSESWDSSVRTFFTGGGAPVSVYKEAVSNTQVPSKYGLQLMALPLHPKLSGFSGDLMEYQRISVACGLAQDAFTLARIVPAREVEDDRPITMRRRQIADLDDMWPK